MTNAVLRTIDELALNTGKPPERVFDEMTLLYQWYCTEAYGNKVVASIGIDGNIDPTSVISIETRRARIELEKKDILVLITDETLPDFRRIGALDADSPDEWERLAEIGVKVAGKNTQRLAIDQMGIYHRKPSSLDINRTLAHQFSLRYFLQEFDSLHGDYAQLRTDYQELFGEPLPRITSRFRILPR